MKLHKMAKIKFRQTEAFDLSSEERVSYMHEKAQLLPQCK